LAETDKALWIAIAFLIVQILEIIGDWGSAAYADEINPSK